MLSNTCYNLEIICDIIRTTIFGVLCSVNIPIIIRLYVLIFCHCIVCHKAIYRFWYIQYFLMVNHKRLMSSMHQHKFFIRRKLYYRENWNNQIKTNYFTDKINRHCLYVLWYIVYTILHYQVTHQSNMYQVNFCNVWSIEDLHVYWAIKYAKLSISVIPLFVF